MPSNKRQLSCRPDEETWDRIEELKPRVAAALGLEKVSDPVLIRLAMMALEEKYPPAKPKK